MKYLFPIFVLFLLVSSPFGYIYADSPIVCPDVNQIQVDIMGGVASAPDGWTGQCAIPLKLKDRWRSTVTVILTESYAYPTFQAECLYLSTDVEKIVRIFKTIPESYSLYDLPGTDPMSGCTVPHSQINSGLDKECYWYKNPIVLK